MNRVHRRLAVLPAIALLGSVLIAPAALANEPQTLVIAQEPPEISFHDPNGDGWGAGDFFTFVASVVAEDGREGTIMGEHRVTAMPTDGPMEEYRVGIAVIDLGGGDTIVFGGQTGVETTQEMMTPGDPLRRVVLGGTGAFAGVYGENVSVRAEDGSWTHTLTFEPVDPAGMVTEIVAEGVSAPVTEIEMTGEAGMQRGDVRTWEMEAETTDGDPVTLYGLHFRTIGEGEQGPGSQTVGILALEDANGDRLIAGGWIQIGPAGDPLPPVGVEIRRPIIGGTGRFLGARGEQTLVHHGDGLITFTSRFTLPPAAAPEETIVFHHDAAAPDGMTDAVAGERTTWEIPLASDAGEEATLRGHNTLIDLADADEPTHRAAGLSTITFADGSTILLSDIRRLDPETGLVSGRCVRAILGGTGRFAGISGEVTRTKEADGQVRLEIAIQR